MRLITVTDKQDKEHKVLKFNSTLGRYVGDYAELTDDWNYFDGGIGKYAIIRHGRRLSIAWDPAEQASGPYGWEWQEIANDGAFQVGPKLLARILQKALDGKDGEQAVSSSFGDGLEFASKGRYVYFQAPCGQKARLTKAEVQRVLDALPQLTG